MPVPGRAEREPAGRELPDGGTWSCPRSSLRPQPTANRHPSPIPLTGHPCQPPGASAAPRQAAQAAQASRSMRAAAGRQEQSPSPAPQVVGDPPTPGAPSLRGGGSWWGDSLSPILLWRCPPGAADGWTRSQAPAIRPPVPDPHPGLHPQRGFCPAGSAAPPGPHRGSGQEGVLGRAGSLPSCPSHRLLLSFLITSNSYLLLLLFIFCLLFFISSFLFLFPFNFFFLLILKTSFLFPFLSPF